MSPCDPASIYFLLIGLGEFGNFFGILLIIWYSVRGRYAGQECKNTVLANY